MKSNNYNPANDFINAIFRTTNGPTVTVNWGNNSTAQYSKSLLSELKDEKNCIWIQDDETGELLYIKEDDKTETAPSAAPVAEQEQEQQTPVNPYTPAELLRIATGGGPALSHRVSITVPSTMGPDTPATPETVDFWKSHTMRELSRIFGGCTALDGAGAWIDGNGKLISESVTVCTSYAESVTAENAQQVKQIAETLRNGMNQDAITIEIDGNAGFVERPAG